MTLTRRGRLTVFFGTILVIVVGGYLVGNAYLRSIGYWGGSSPGQEVIVEIPRGASTDKIGEILEEAGVVKSAFGFRVATFTEGGVSEVQAGKHSLPTGLNARDALAALIESTPEVDVAVNVTFPENLWLTDFAQVLERDTHLSAKKFLKVLRSGKVRSKYLPPGKTNMEGLLFPSTYEVIERDTEVDVARRLVEEFERQAKQAGIDDVQQRLGVTPYEAITIASMIQAEAKFDEEKPTIARVIYNRIEANDLLGIDATVYYAIGDPDYRGEPLTVSDLNLDSPYNTRENSGIPPGPIGAAGSAALEAAANPAEGDWYYYVVSDCEGHHAFSTNESDFAADRAVYEALDC